jgi:hypothetical protein
MVSKPQTTTKKRKRVRWKEEPNDDSYDRVLLQTVPRPSAEGCSTTLMTTPASSEASSVVRKEITVENPDHTLGTGRHPGCAGESRAQDGRGELHVTSQSRPPPATPTQPTTRTTHPVQQATVLALSVVAKSSPSLVDGVAIPEMHHDPPPQDAIYPHA